MPSVFKEPPCPKRRKQEANGVDEFKKQQDEEKKEQEESDLQRQQQQRQCHQQRQQGKLRLQTRGLGSCLSDRCFVPVAQLLKTACSKVLLRMSTTALFLFVAAQALESEPKQPSQVFTPSGGSERPRVAVCFFGLTRSLQWTLPSIENRVLNTLRQSNMDVDVFVHTYSLLEVNNQRAGENGINYWTHADEFQILSPTRSLVTNQDDFDLAWPDPLSMSHYNWNYSKKFAVAVVRNIFHAYVSMANVWDIMAEFAAEEKFEYDAVVMARPDVWYHVDIDLPSRAFPLPERTVFLPSFDTETSVGGRKNDRFAYGSVTAMRIFTHRLATFTEAGAGRYKGTIDSEWVLGHHLEVNNISVETTEFPVTRIRLTGNIPQFDHDRVREVCQSGNDPMSCEMVSRGFQFPTESPLP